MHRECRYCYSEGKHDPGCPALTIADLRRRIRLARGAGKLRHWEDFAAEEMMRLLDLRRPLPRTKRKGRR